MTLSSSKVLHVFHMCISAYDSVVAGKEGKEENVN
jgi:hypothetical protein